VKILYFAWLRTKIGVAEEQVDLPAEVRDVAGLLRWLQGRGSGFAEALKDLSVVRVAVNQDYVKTDHLLRPGDEVALFPPVTGG
jgi:molybdopterin synthase sulfur carrier subunit